MRGLIYEGQDYVSISQACKALGISYQKVRRLCRHYVRASRDPTVAIRWALGVEKKAHNEPKTQLYREDLERGFIRQGRFKDKLMAKVIGGLNGKND